MCGWPKGKKEGLKWWNRPQPWREATAHVVEWNDRTNVSCRLHCQTSHKLLISCTVYTPHFPVSVKRKEKEMAVAVMTRYIA
jgi:hypothetical protein